MALVCFLLAGLAWITILTKRTFLGVLMGFQLLGFSIALAYVVASSLNGNLIAMDRGHWVATVVLLMGVAQLTVGLALALRLFFIRKSIAMSSLESLKH